MSEKDFQGVSGSTKGGHSKLRGQPLQRHVSAWRRCVQIEHGEDLEKYVDDRDALKVSKAGDIITGNLLLRLGSSNAILFGCRDWNGNKTFIIHLGNSLNRIQCWINNPITLISTHGFLFKLGDNIIRFGKSSSDIRIYAYQDIMMNEKHIVDLHDPVNVQDAATKNYIDTALTSENPQNFATKNYVEAALNSDNPQDFATKNYVENALSSVNANPL